MPLPRSAELQRAKVFINVAFIHLAFCMFSVVPRTAFGYV